jgi:hypothetical protein
VVVPVVPVAVAAVVVTLLVGLAVQVSRLFAFISED